MLYTPRFKYNVVASSNLYAQPPLWNGTYIHTYKELEGNALFSLSTYILDYSFDSERYISLHLLGGALVTTSCAPYTSYHYNSIAKNANGSVCK